MSVPKGKRKESQFEVFHHSTKMRREVADLMKREFGFSPKKFENELRKQFGGRSFDELDDNEKLVYNRMKEQWMEFYKELIKDERKAILDFMRNIGKEIQFANAIYPTNQEGLNARRLHQEMAIGYCHALISELQHAIETLPVKINSYARFADMIDRQIALLKSWRKSDNKLKETWAVTDNASNFANVNNNGNANNNNASNANGVRPDFNLAE